MNNLPKLSQEEYEKIVEIVALIAWKIELQENHLRPRALKLAINTTVAAAENFAVKPFEQKLSQDLKNYLLKLPEDCRKIEEFNQVRSIRKKMRDAVKLFMAKAEEREIRCLANFIFRFAARLSEVSGQSFAGMGRKLDASEAEILLDIRDELPL